MDIQKMVEDILSEIKYDSTPRVKAVVFLKTLNDVGYEIKIKELQSQTTAIKEAKMVIEELMLSSIGGISHIKAQAWLKRNKGE